MSISVELISLTQGLNLSTGEQSNYLSFRLPNGKICQALVSDEEAQTVVELFVQGGGVPRASTSLSTPTPLPKMPIVEPLPSGFSAGEDASGAPALVFGGSNGQVPSLVPSVARAPGSPRRRPRLVGKDDAGNPILDYPDEPDNDVIPTEDSDGVAQI